REAREVRHSTSPGRSALHGAVSSEYGEQDRRVGTAHVEELACHPFTQRVSDTGSAHRRMHLEIARIQRPPLHAMQIRTPLGRHHTPNHVAIDLGNTETPLTSLQLIELEEIGIPRYAEGDVAFHWARSGDRSECRIVITDGFTHVDA